MKIMIVGDSLCLPRKENGISVKYDNIYPVLLSKRFKQYEFINFSKRSNTIVNVRSELNEIILYEPKVVIFQIGVVDCAPRIFSKRERYLIGKLPSILRNIIINKRKEKRNLIQSKNSLSKVYVKPTTFVQTYVDVINFLHNEIPDVKIILIPIVGFLKGLEVKSSGFNDNIELYNKFITKISEETVCHTLDILDLLTCEECFIDDFYHLSEKGHEVIFKKLVKFI